MNIYDEPKIDCHNHVIDPVRFPYAADTAYRPAGQEIGSAPYFMHVLDAYGVRHALLVGPNSGYGTDNRCLLDAIARSGGRFKGIAVVPNDVEISVLERLKAAGGILLGKLSTHEFAIGGPSFDLPWPPSMPRSDCLPRRVRRPPKSPYRHCRISAPAARLSSPPKPMPCTSDG